MKGQLILQDNTQFIGESFGYESSINGEVVFNTALTGYPDSLSDPSYKGQILILTYPLIGNYGVPFNDIENSMLKYFESDKIHINGLIISDYSNNFNHWNANKSLKEWLIENKIPALYGIDTRLITKKIRNEGSMLGKIIINDIDVNFNDPNKENLVAQVSIKEKKIYGNGEYKIALIDCGVKNNIIRLFLKNEKIQVIRYPYNYDFNNDDYDGLFISNGPSDPKLCVETIKNIKKSLDKNIPIFGICLGHQLLSLAIGADTYKLKFGHRGHNQPVLLNNTDKAYITSQNHGYAVDTSTLPENWIPMFTNLNDNSNEGIKHISKPYFSTQFHPEASGGPLDTSFLFNNFIKNIKKAHEKNK
jgi:carbamoyl-phosphate synthase small subunit